MTTSYSNILGESSYEHVLVFDRKLCLKRYLLERLGQCTYVNQMILQEKLITIVIFNTDNRGL